MRPSLRSPAMLAACILTIGSSISRGQSAQPSSSGPSGALQAQSSASENVIPGPLRSLLRMAGISQKASEEEVVPLLARNIYVQGYEGWRSGGRPTEFLILLGRYVNQAKELSELAGTSGVVHISGCDDSAQLLHILGYRLRQQCGQNDAILVTADAERAFLTTDSGFPLPSLEESLRKNKEFSYRFPASRVPVLFSSDEWIKARPTKKKVGPDFLETLLHDPELARLYWALYRMDAQTREELRKSIGLARLLRYAPVLDFYGSEICIQNGHVLVPGGASAESAWKDLVGVSPDTPDFVVALVGKDKGWLAAYFDSLSRLSPAQQTHFANPHSLKTLYSAFLGPGPVTDAARAAFRPAPSLLLLLTRLRWDNSGQPLVPGGLELWKDILAQKSDSKAVRDWGKRASHMKSSEQLLQAMFAFARLDTQSTPLDQYLVFSELEARRGSERHLRAETFRLLSRKFSEFSDQYLIFSEFPELSDESISGFVRAAEAVDSISNHTLRGNSMGTFQASVGLWQILARQGQIPRAQLNASLQKVVALFAKLSSPAQLFDAGGKAVTELALVSTGQPSVSQDELIEVLAGPN
ncbi:MAG TPA: hypothetical protein VGU90_16805, partial [Terriglobales bacterium]|nr:hypothetical protein [Terriglobales bacterium]